MVVVILGVVVCVVVAAGVDGVDVVGMGVVGEGGIAGVEVGGGVTAPAAAVGTFGGFEAVYRAYFGSPATSR
jgi:hypothetical protein